MLLAFSHSLMRHLLLSSLTVFCSVCAWAEPSLPFVSAVELNSPTGQVLSAFVADVFGRAKTPYQLSYRPALRAEREFKSQQFAGDVGRSVVFAQRFPAAIRVDPPYFSLPFYAISHHRTVRGWSDLYGQKIAYLRGIAAVEDNLKEHSTLYPSDSVSACLRMLKALRVEYCVLNASAPPNVEFTQPQLSQSEFAHLNTHIWLAPEQAALAAKLSKAIRAMEKDGSLARYQYRFLHPNSQP